MIEENIRHLEESARRGDVDAQFNLGVCYRDGRGVEQDQRKAEQWFVEAAAQGHAGAQFGLGVCFELGREVPDYSEAAQWYAKAAQQGYAPAQNRFGLFCEEGKGVTKDLEAAENWYTEAARQGNKLAVQALERLGKCPCERVKARSANPDFKIRK